MGEVHSPKCLFSLIEMSEYFVYISFSINFLAHAAQKAALRNISC